MLLLMIKVKQTIEYFNIFLVTFGCVFDVLNFLSIPFINN